jgi:hypothetical protein
MALTTYAELKLSIADWLNRDDLTAVIPDFITLAEHQMEREVRHYKMIERSNANLDSRYSQVPAGWLETIRFGITSGDTYRLEMVSIDRILELRERNMNTGGRPKYYCHVGDTFELFPTPDAAYATELVYYERIPVLSDSNTTNWLLDEAPDAYLYGSLLQAAPYLAEDQRITTWATLYAGAVASLNNASDKTRTSSGNLRMKINTY